MFTILITEKLLLHISITDGIRFKTLSTSLYNLYTYIRSYILSQKNSKMLAKLQSYIHSYTHVLLVIALLRAHVCTLSNAVIKSTCVYVL